MVKKEHDKDTEEVYFAVDKDGKVVIDFNNLETLLYYAALETADNINLRISRDAIVDLLGAFSYELLNYLFPEELKDYCNEDETVGEMYS